MRVIKKIVSFITVFMLMLSVIVVPQYGVFAMSEYTLTATADSIGGNISPAGVTTVAAGKSVTCSIIPDEGYSIDKVYIDGELYKCVNEYTFFDFQADHTISASFKIKKLGDMNEDGYITSNDISPLISHLISDSGYDDRADVNYDGDTNVRDLIRLVNSPVDILTHKFDSVHWNISDGSGTAEISEGGDTYSFDTTEYSVDSAYYEYSEASNWSDYQVNADIFYDNYDFTSKSSYIALVFRRVSTRKSYEFRLSVDRDSIANIVGRLYRRSSDGYTELATFDVDLMQNVIGANKLLLGRTYNVKVLCKSNTFYFFLNNALVGSYTDDDNPYLTGSIGFKSYRAKGSISDVHVTDRTRVAYRDMYIDGSKDGESINLRYGEEVDNNSQKILAVDYDSTILSARINDRMVAESVGNAFFDMPFTGSYTGDALTAMGYGASGIGIDTVASYIANDKLSIPKDISATGLFFSPQINVENYKITLDFTVDEKYGSGTPTYGLVFGAPAAELKNCYNFVLQVNGANGYVQGSKVRLYNASGGGSDYFVPSTQISTADRQDYTYFGAKISIEAVFSYDGGSDKTTVTFTVTGNEKTVQTYSMTHTGMLKGRAAIFSSRQGGVSFDNFTCSSQNSVRINAFSMQKDFLVNTSENPVSDLNSRLISNESAVVTAANAMTYKTLINDCNKYSDAELENLSERAKTAYNNLAGQLSALNVPFGTVLEDCRFSDADSAHWYNGFEYDKGKKYIKNSKLHISQIPYGISTNCCYLSDNYGEVSSVSADVRMNSYYGAAGIILNLGHNGGYRATVTLNRDTDNVNGRNSATVRIYRKTSKGISTVASRTGIDICRAEWFNMQLCISAENVIKLYINYALACSADLSNNPEIFKEGCSGVISQSGDADFDSFVAYGNSASPETSAVTPETTFFSEDFESGTNNYFLEENQNKWSVKTEGGNSYYGVDVESGISDIADIGNNTALFSDDFDSYGNNASGSANKLAMNANGWNVPNNTTGNYNTGSSFTVPSALQINLLTSNFAGSGDWSDYVVSCDITLNSSDTGHSYTYITGRVTGNAGYWLRIWSKEGILRGYELETFSNFSKTSVLASYNFPSADRIPCGETYNVKMAFAGESITCYLNDTLVLSVQDSAYSQGCAGFYTSSSSVSSVTFDNFAVYETNITVPQTTKTYLHLFESNPTVRLKMKFESGTGDCKDFGFVVRNSPVTAYVKIGYDLTSNKWYIKESQCEGDLPVNFATATTSNALTENVWYDVTLAVSGDTATLTVDRDGADEYSYVFSGISNCGTGLLGFYTDNTALCIDDIDITLPDGDTALSGIVEYGLYDDSYMAVFEIEELSNGTLVGVGTSNVGLSTDGGATFSDVTSQKPELYDGAYPSLTKLHDGTFLRINSSFEVYSSSDDMASWEKICECVAPYSSGNRITRIFHVNSINELKLSNGNYRIFMPVGVRTYANAYTTTSSGHYTEVYYSDDGGVTWAKSANDTTNVLYASKNDSSSDWTESKVVLCDDGSLRMYYSRNALGCMQYTVSTDDGITWSGLYQVPQMQCASSSFSLIKDDSPLAGDTDYYLVWVNNEPVYLGSSFSRTRLSLAKSTDGKNWTYLCDIERMTPEVYSSDLTMTSPIFQIVDPSIYVNDDYVFVSYGCSGNSGTSFHNALRLRIARIEKSALTPKSWNASNVSNMLFTQSLTLTAAPKTAFSLNETFTYSGGTVRITRLDGTVKDIDTSRMYVETKPDMTAAGQKTVVLYDMNGFSVSYSINVS